MSHDQARGEVDFRADRDAGCLRKSDASGVLDNHRGRDVFGELPVTGMCHAAVYSRAVEVTCRGGQPGR